MIKRIQDNFMPDDPICCPIWQASDVKQKASEMGVELTDGQIASVLDAMDKYHDASIGVNWETVGDAIRNLLMSQMLGN